MRNSQGLQQKCMRLQVVGNKNHRLVGAPRFELGTSCAQGRRATRLRYAPTSVGLEFTAVCHFVDAQPPEGPKLVVRALL